MIRPNKEVRIDGAAMRVLDIGSGPALLFGHGWLCDATMWRAQIDAFSDRYRVIVPELWGHGGSDAMPAATRTMADLARQHRDLLDQLDVPEAAVIGFSCGGMWGGELALLAPERVSSLVLMATSLAAEPAPSRDAFLAGVEDMASHRAISAELAENLIALLYGPAFRATDPAQVEVHKARLLTWSPARVADSVAPLGAMIFNRRDALEEARALSMPLLTVASQGDLALPAARAEQMAAALGSPFHAIAGAGHLLPLEVPDAINTLLEKFLVEASETASAHP